MASLGLTRRAVRDYVMDSKESGFAPNASLTKAVVKSDFNNTQVCQVLTFRGDANLIIIFSQYEKKQHLYLY